MSKIRLTVAYKQPEDLEAFYAYYAATHVPLAEKIPGLTSFEWSKVLGTPTGEPSPYALLAELTFESMDGFGAGMGSPEGAAAAADMANFAAAGADTFISEVVS
jgi:uncharacterized protein (TIGR02118 family)